MPELIERGYVYIAQPPLYKVKLGKDERYLKDDHEREQYMLNAALHDAMLDPGAGAGPIQGDALTKIAQSYLVSEAVIKRIARSFDERALHALLNGLHLDFSSGATTRAAADELRKALGNGDTHVAEEQGTDGRWRIIVTRIRHGATRRTVLDDEFLRSGDYAQILETAKLVQGLVGEGATIVRGEQRHPVASFRDAMAWLLREVEAKATLQRYKGLGEMNPEQLWETTMDPKSRRMLKVQIEDAIGADEIFTKLMGDEVEPRREFIERNALVARLDV
jgi:DNA gyrase subunit B